MFWPGITESVLWTIHPEFKYVWPGPKFGIKRGRIERVGDNKSESKDG